MILQAALLAAGMCLDFKVHEKQLWNGVLQQLLSFELVSLFLFFKSAYTDIKPGVYILNVYLDIEKLDYFVFAV